MTEPRPCTDNDGDFDDTGCALAMNNATCTDHDGDRDDTGCVAGVATIGNVTGDGGGNGGGWQGGSDHQGGGGD
jgi:hypothetical protein